MTAQDVTNETNAKFVLEYVETVTPRHRRVTTTTTEVILAAWSDELEVRETARFVSEPFTTAEELEQLIDSEVQSTEYSDSTAQEILDWRDYLMTVPDLSDAVELSKEFVIHTPGLRISGKYSVHRHRR